MYMHVRYYNNDKDIYNKHGYSFFQLPANLCSTIASRSTIGTVSGATKMPNITYGYDAGSQSCPLQVRNQLLSSNMSTAAKLVISA